MINSTITINNPDNVCGAVIIIKSVREFANFAQRLHLKNVRQLKFVSISCDI